MSTELPETNKAGPSFKDLKVWQSGIQLTTETYQLTQSFPSTETYGLVSQMRRASVSVPSNIAEGWGRDSDRDFARICSIALGSLRELQTLLFLTIELGYATPERVAPIAERCDSIGKSLHRLKSTLLSRSESRLVRETVAVYDADSIDPGELELLSVRIPISDL